MSDQLELTLESLQTELASYKYKPHECLFEYIWNSFDAGATEVNINYKVPDSELGYVENVSVEDNGRGWDFKREQNTKTFLSSSKQDQKNKNKSLPRGKYGRGRYVFIWIADSLEIFSAEQRLELKKDARVNPIKDGTAPKKGTKVVFKNPNIEFSNILYNSVELCQKLVLEFCWFLKGNPSFSVILNGKKIDFETNIKKEEILNKIDFDENILKDIIYDFQVSLILWNEKPKEWSSFYFIDSENGKEIFTESTRMNKKSDDFWHSVYVISNLFKDDDLKQSESLNGQTSLEGDDKKKIKNEIIKVIREKLVELRKPYLVGKSDLLIPGLRNEKIIPNLSDFGIYDEKSYEELLKTIYIISPSLFVGRDKKEKKFICATFAGLLSTQDNSLIRIILEQLHDLTDEEKVDLLSILKRTSLSNVVRTIKEIDHRLHVIDDLEKLVFEYKKETLEVKHLQKMLNEDFWIFGEKFKLFTNTEGSLKKTLFDYAKNILKIDNPEIITDSRKEVDLFLVKTEQEGEDCQRNIIIEIKRPSKKLGKPEYDQIEKYSIDIMKESICNAANMYWEFYLIGDDYNEYIINKISDARNHGEKSRGLTSNPHDNGRMKIYVRKWSDILRVEWGYKMKFLKEKLKIQAKAVEYQSPSDILSNLSSNN